MVQYIINYFIFMYMHYNHCHWATAHLQLNTLLLLLLNTMSKLRILAWCSGVEYFIFYLYHGSNTYVEAVVYLACKDVVLSHECLVFLYWYQ